MVFERRLSYGVREETIVMVFERTLTTQLQGECSILLDENEANRGRSKIDFHLGRDNSSEAD